MPQKTPFAEGHTRLVIYDSVLFNRTGQVRRWANAVERGFTNNARVLAPVRSGELKSGIRGEVKRIGMKHLETTIHSDAPHTLYVLKGTTGPIMSNRYWAFQQKAPHLRAPRGGMLNPRKPLTTGIDMNWMHAHGYAMRVRAGNGYPETLHLVVSGQRANNFFADAADLTARRHSSLRGFRPGFSY